MRGRFLTVTLGEGPVYCKVELLPFGGMVKCRRLWHTPAGTLVKRRGHVYLFRGPDEFQVVSGPRTTEKKIIKYGEQVLAYELGE